MTDTERTQRLALAATIGLTFVTGVVDAVGFLALDRVFTGNMTGNIVILGMGIAGADELPVAGPAIALAAFTLAAYGAGMLLRKPRSVHPPGWHDRVTVLLGAGAATLAALAVLAAVTDGRPGPGLQIAMAAATAAVMGSQAVAARTLAVTDMTTVVVTSTLAALAGESWPRGGGGALLNRRLGAILVLFAGAVGGALLLRLHTALAFGTAAAITAVVAVLGHTRLSLTAAGRHAPTPEPTPQRP
ncbi:YoaK family protein [Mycolicibacterium palauense]|uniref:YoaK family protein n=1 Tax=Mycolicibacterium palauense TaxID=2034511 RepID=UPI000BFEB8EC|nr:YoaK family protein [Mycolicibacterium palauense]